MSSVVDDARSLARLWLERHLLVYSERYHKAGGDWSDLYVDRAEVDAFLRGKPADAEALGAVHAAELALRERMSAQAAAAAEAGAALPLEELRAGFDIDDERLLDIVLSLLIVEVDPELLRAFSHAWCDFTRKHVEVGFLLELVARTSEERERLAAFFLRGDHPLLRLRVLEVDAGAPARPLLQRSVRLADRAIRFLCGDRDPGLEGGRLVRCERPLDSVLVPEELARTFLSAFARVVRGRGRLLVHGPAGSGRRSLCEVAATNVRRPLLLIDADDLPAERVECERRLLPMFREARFADALPLITGADAFAVDADARLRALDAAANAYGGPLLFTAMRRVPSLAERTPGLVEVAVPHPTPDVQRVLWQRALPNATWSGAFGIDDIVTRYSLAGGTIEAVATAVEASLHGRRPRPPLTPGIVLPIIRDHLSHRLGSVAVPVARGFAWDDLVVPENTQSALKELVGFVRNRDRIVRDWGFGAKLAYGRGVAALFHGPPGTGKTMAASIVGTLLGMEVFQIDLSRVVDKYIGETEKNLGRVFDEGARAQAILLFDEADSLFGKRTSVQSSVDRYANLEVNFLLQRIEQYEGISVLTSNNPENIDDAFKRRIRFKVEFPFPNAVDRERLWRTMMPPEAPVDADVSFGRLAERFELSGAHIKSVVLRAATMAADEEGRLTMDVLVRAGNREYAEMGKLVRG